MGSLNAVFFLLFLDLLQNLSKFLLLQLIACNFIGNLFELIQFLNILHCNVMFFVLRSLEILILFHSAGKQLADFSSYFLFLLCKFFKSFCFNLPHFNNFSLSLGDIFIFCLDLRKLVVSHFKLFFHAFFRSFDFLQVLFTE